MKIPARAPQLGEMLKEQKQKRLVDIIGRIPEPTVSGKYLHWENLRHRTPPEGLTVEDWWCGLKLAREGQSRTISLRDLQGGKFVFTLADPLPELLHQIDLTMGGTVKMPEQVANPESRKEYVVRSLIEEAVTSSQLEGAATTREVAKEMIRQGRDPHDRSERMILNNFRAMERIIEVKDQSLTRELILELQSIVTDGTLDDPSAAGRFRRCDENRVVGDDYGEVFHIPPPADQLEDRLAAMIKFANAKSPSYFVHPAIRSMILHFWLSYDHPFVDGNGRTARALFYWSMLRHGYRLFEFVSISRIILKVPKRYGRAFLDTETDGNDLTYFLLYHANVIDRSIQELYEYLERRMQQVRSLELELRGIASLNSRQRDFIRHALRHPGFRYSIESHRRSHGIVYETARSDLLDLVSRGLLEKGKVGKAWIFTPVPDLESRLMGPG